jgi:tol-pal system protein YbgF
MNVRAVLTTTLLGFLVIAGSPSPASAGWRSQGPGDEKTADKDAPANISKETLVELLQQLDSLQTEVRQLRNQVEVQGHDLKQLRSRLQDLTADLDRRVRSLERVGGPAPTATVPENTGRQHSTSSAIPTATEQRAYDAAFQLMKQGDYTGAGRAFHAFIAKYPSSPLAPNAQYWIAETSYIKRNFAKALKDYIKVRETYPGSRKVPDATLKIGYTYYELHEWDKARTFLSEVASRYPNTVLARSAKSRLTLMQKEGH